MSKMSPRERVQRAVSLKEPDRVPLDIASTVGTGIVVECYENLARHFGIEPKIDLTTRMFMLTNMDEKILRELRVDTRGVWVKAPDKHPEKWLDDNTVVDEMGLTLRRAKGSYYYDMIDSPLKNATIEDMEKYPWSDPLDEGRFRGIREEAKAYHEAGYAVIGPCICGSIFEHAWYLRGFEKFLMDCMLDKKFAEALMRINVEWNKKLYGRYLQEVGKHLDIVWVADDLGGQQAPLFLPQYIVSWLNRCRRSSMPSSRNGPMPRYFCILVATLSPLLKILSR